MLSLQMVFVIFRTYKVQKAPSGQSVRESQMLFFGARSVQSEIVPLLYHKGKFHGFLPVHKSIQWIKPKVVDKYSIRNVKLDMWMVFDTALNWLNVNVPATS